MAASATGVGGGAGSCAAAEPATASAASSKQGHSVKRPRELMALPRNAASDAAQVSDRTVAGEGAGFEQPASRRLLRREVLDRNALAAVLGRGDGLPRGLAHD